MPDRAYRVMGEGEKRDLLSSWSEEPDDRRGAAALSSDAEGGEGRQGLSVEPTGEEATRRLSWHDGKTPVLTDKGKRFMLPLTGCLRRPPATGAVSGGRRRSRVRSKAGLPKRYSAGRLWAAKQKAITTPFYFSKALFAARSDAAAPTGSNAEKAVDPTTDKRKKTGERDVVSAGAKEERGGTVATVCHAMIGPRRTNGRYQREPFLAPGGKGGGRPPETSPLFTERLLRAERRGGAGAYSNGQAEGCHLVPWHSVARSVHGRRGQEEMVRPISRSYQARRRLSLPSQGRGVV